jgi:hypothetical protein
MKSTGLSRMALNDFTGGLNDTVSLDSLKPNELVRADNVMVFKSGGIETRPGTSKLNATSYGTEIDQDISWPLSDGTFIHLIMRGSKLYKVDDTTGVVVEKKALSAAVIGYAVVEEKLFFVDGVEYFVYGHFRFTSASGTQTIALNDIVKNIGSSGGGATGHFFKALAAHGSTNLGTENFNNVVKWQDVTDGIIPDDIRAVPIDGKGTVSGADLTNIRKCTMMEYHPSSGRIFYAGNPQDATVLYYGEILNAYAAVGSAVVRPTSASGPITGLQAFMSSLLVSYKRAWMYWDGITIGVDAKWRRMPLAVGCVNHWAKALTPYSLTFWGNDGIYTIYPGLLMDSVTVVATKELYSRLDENKVELSIKSMKNPERVRVCYFDGNLYFAYGDVQGQRNNKVLVLNWDLKSFVKITGWQVNDWHIGDNEELWFASKNYILKYTSESINDIDVDTGAAKAVAAKAWIPPLKLGSISDAFIMKRLNTVFVCAKQYEDDDSTANMQVELSSDYVSVTNPTVSGQVAINESLVWGRQWGLVWGFIDLVVQRITYGKVGFRHAVKIESETVDNRWFLYSLGFEFAGLDGTEAIAVNATETPWITD